MTLWAHVYGGYASYDNAYQWGDAEWAALKFVQILKGQAANGAAMLPRPDGSKVKISNALSHAAFNAWGTWAAARVQSLYPQGGAYLVPIPSSTCLVLGDDEKGTALAKAVATRSAGFQVIDAIHWAEKLQKASKGGPRDARTLLANARARNDLEKRPIVLVDDVITGGGHAMACAQIMRSFGHEVSHVVAAAHTVKSPPTGGLFKIEPWDLEANPFFDF